MPHKKFPTLFLICSAEEARWVDVESASEYEIGAFRNPYDRYSDREGQFGSGKNPAYGSKGGEPDDVNGRKRDHMLHHLRSVAEKTAEYWRNGHYALLGYSAPERWKNILEKELRRVLPKEPLLEIRGEYIHIPIHEVRKLLKKQWLLSVL